MINEEDLIHVYFMPGMAAASSIFEHIRLPEDQFKMHLLNWKIPKQGEDLQTYSRRMAEEMNFPNSVLIGVSFGGIIVQEMAKFLDLKRLIIISSVKCEHELPARMKFAAKTGLFKWIPTGLVDYVDYFEKVAVGDFLKQRAKLYKQYISIRDKKYLDWSIKNMVTWKCDQPIKDIIHIHGSEDVVFPLKNIKNAIIVEGGTHIMVVNRFRWFNENLPDLIKTGKLKTKNKNKHLI